MHDEGALATIPDTPPQCDVMNCCTGCCYIQGFEEHLPTVLAGEGEY